MAGPLSHIRVLDLSRVLAGPCAGQKFGDLARYGLSYEDLKKTNPRLIYCSVTGFGQTGPYRERPGYDFMIQGMGGMMSVTGEPDDAPGGGPQRAGVPIADIITGMYASIAICAALVHRERSGRGQHLDLALLDSQIALLAYQNTNYFATGRPPKRIGNLHPNIVPYQPFGAADGELILACGNDNLYRKFCEAAGCPELAGDPRFATNGKRVENRAELTRLLGDVFRKRTKREWLELLEAAGVPNGPINDVAQVFEEPQVKARGAALSASAFSAPTTLRASHQFPGGRGDVRDEMVQIIARDAKAASVELEVQVYPGASLFKPNEQWNALVNGQLDKAGVVVLADAWLAGAIASKRGCIRKPDDIKGLKVRSAGPTFAAMWQAAGASIVSIPSNEVYNALQTGVADATDTSSGSFVSFRIYEQVKCVTAPGDNALWFMYEPVLMSKKSFSRLNKKQQEVLLAAGQKSQQFFAEKAKGLDDEMVKVFKDHNVEVVTLTAQEYDAWLKVAEKSSYAEFAKEVPNGKKLIDEALSVK